MPAPGLDPEDKQATIMLSLIYDHGRATPLVWLTVDKRTLKNNRSLYEHRVLVRLAELLPPDVQPCRYPARWCAAACGRSGRFIAICTTI